MNKKPTVLVAEDDKLYAEIYESKLAKEGFEVVVVGNGKEAIEKAKKLKPGLILLDLVMPVMDGFTALEILKNDPATKEIRVVVMSNLGQDSDVQRAKKLGADEYLVKASISIQELMEKIKSYLK
jgi:two-component system, OmpR family, alkaline phosphatase synthesis response regulator PhoP